MADNFNLLTEEQKEELRRQMSVAGPFASAGREIAGTDRAMKDGKTMKGAKINLTLDGSTGRGAMKIDVDDARVLQNMLQGQLGQSNQAFPAGQNLAPSVSVQDESQRFPNQQEFYRQQAGERMIGFRPENPEEMSTKQKFLNALQDMGQYQFDPRAGWGNVVNALGAGARGAAVREEQYQNSMKWYENRLAEIRNQLERNEIDMQEAQAKMTTARSYAQQVEQKHATDTKRVSLDTTTTGYGPSTANFYKNYYGRSGFLQKDESGVEWMQAADKLDLDKELNKEGSAVRRDFINAQIADMNMAINNATQQMAQAKDPKAVMAEIKQMTDARDAMIDERDRKASAMQSVEARVARDAVLAQQGQAKIDQKDQPKPADKYKALKEFNFRMTQAKKTEDLEAKTREYELAEEQARTIEDPKLRAKKLGEAHLQIYLGGKKGDLAGIRNYIQAMEDEGMSDQEIEAILVNGMNISRGAIRRALTEK